MSVTDLIHFDKEGEVEPGGWRGLIFHKLYLALVILLVAILAFGLGRLTATKQSGEIKIEYDPALVSNSQFPISNFQSTSNENSKLKIENSATVYASSKGTRYYYIHCSGIGRISEKNKISFPNAAAAEATGLTLASGCKP